MHASPSVAPVDELARASDALAALSDEIHPIHPVTFESLEDALSDWRTPRSAGDLGTQFPRLLRRAHSRLRGAPERDAFNRALVARLSSRLPLRLDDLDLPASVLPRVPTALRRLHSFLGEPSETYDLGDDDFLRDVRFAAGWTVPCGSEVIDLRARVSLRGSLQIALKARVPSVGWRRLRPGDPPAWFAPHVESRYLDEFDEAGWEATYLNVAALLRRHTDVVGVVGYSWFYDPEVEVISPWLAYLRRRPGEAGATFIRGHTTEFDVRNATAKSRARKRLFEHGSYTPTGYKMIWLRRDILSWAAGG